jgi:hypothetical protein
VDGEVCAACAPLPSGGGGLMSSSFLTLDKMDTILQICFGREDNLVPDEAMHSMILIVQCIVVV